MRAMAPIDARTLAGIIRAEIYAGGRAAGEQLPSAVELAEQYGLPLKVVRDVLRLLLDQGLIVSRRPQGNFVRTRQATTAAALRLLLSEAGELLSGVERSGKPETRMAVRAWRARAREAGADV
jgi:DNA-binding FadR family transcriptional regulator